MVATNVFSGDGTVIMKVFNRKLLLTSCCNLELEIVGDFFVWTVQVSCVLINCMCALWCRPLALLPFETF